MSDAATSPEPTYDPSAEVVDLCRDLIRIDTTNPGDNTGPGERDAAEYVAEKLDEVGIQAELYESAPRRTSVLARWGDVPGRDAKPLLVHGHLDVVPADAADWSVDPFSAEIQDGCIWGRGAVDMKDFDAIALSAIRARARAGAMPSRPVVLAFTADEEAGSSFGAAPLMRDRREWLEDCDAAVGEVGGFSVTVRDQRMYLIQAAEKGMAWMRLTARGTAGHGSMRNGDNAVTRLASAVARLGSHSWPVRLTPAMEVLLAAVGDIAGEEATPDNAEALVEEFGSAARMLSAVIRNSASPTMLSAGYKVNVIPGKAVAHVDGRFLPGYEDEFFETFHELLGDGIDVDFVTHQHGVETPYAGRRARRDHQGPAGRGPRRPGAAVPDARGNRRQAVVPAGHRLLRLRAAAAAGRPRLHRALPWHRRAGAGRRSRVRRPGLRPVPRPRLTAGSRPLAVSTRPLRIRYGGGADQWGDLYLPALSPHGIVVVIHGGFWKAQYDAALGEPLARDLAGRGWAAYNLEYRRVGQGGGGAPGDSGTLDDVAAGIDALADVPRLATDIVVTLGHSAGGQLAAWAAGRHRFDRWAPVRVAVTAVVCQAGVLDLARAHEEGLGGGAVGAFMGGAPGPGYDQADPMSQVPLEVPVWCVHGSQDEIVPPHHSADYVRAAVAAGGAATLVECDGDHFAVANASTDAWSRVVAVLDAL